MDNSVDQHDENEKVVVNLTSPHAPHSYHKPAISLISKESIACPVTAVALPSDIPCCLIARGPWIECIPYKVSKKRYENTRSDNYHYEQAAVRHLAFGNGYESNTVHGIVRGLDVVIGQTQPFESTHETIWVFFGGRKLSFASMKYTMTIHPKQQQQYEYPHYSHQDLLSVQPFSPAFIYDDFPKVDVMTHHFDCHGSSQYIFPYLTVSDWIWDVRLLSLLKESDYSHQQYSQKNVDDNTIADAKTKLHFVIAIGLAHNIIELWTFKSIVYPTSMDIQNYAAYLDHGFRKEQHHLLSTCRLRKIVCDVRCITYCLSLYGWKHNIHNSCSHTNNLESITLSVAVGTVSNQILVWNVLNKIEASLLLEDENKCFQQNVSKTKVFKHYSKPVHHTLTGHEGVIYSCKFGLGGRYLASTSDDRSIRLWKKTNNPVKDSQFMDDTNYSSWNSHIETGLEAKFISDDSHGTYLQIWVGFSHTARVWDCSFFSLSSRQSLCHEKDRNNCSQNFAGLVSAGEDGTVRVWGVNTGTEIATLKGHACKSIWKLCSKVFYDSNYMRDEVVLMTGGNDGTAKLWDLRYHILSNQSSYKESNDGISPDLLQSLNFESRRIIQVPLDTKRCLGIAEIDEVAKDVQALIVNKAPQKKKGKKENYTDQNICGMDFFVDQDGQDCLLLATKCGNLFVISMNSFQWEKCAPWTRDSSACKNNDPSIGAYLAIHPNRNIISVGTTTGDIFISSLERCKTDVIIHDMFQSDLILSSPKYLGIQSLAWIDDHNLVSLHVRGVVWWTFPPCYFSDENSSISNMAEKPFVKRVLSMGNIRHGIPTTMYFDESSFRFFLGDSRGNIALFDLNQLSQKEHAYNSPEEVVNHVPTFVLQFAHQKEHVTHIIGTDDGKGILSIGNDGCLLECAVEIDAQIKIRKRISTPIPNLSGLSKIWRISHSDEDVLVVSGFHGNNLVLWNISHAYQLLSINIGSRQRRHEVWFRGMSIISPISPLKYIVATCLTSKNGLNQVMIHSNMFQTYNMEEGSKVCIELPYSLGQPCHGETILDVKVIESTADDAILMLSASNDCTIKVSRYKDGRIMKQKCLPPHESCIRALCFSRCPGSRSTLIVAVGGKLRMTFYRLDETYQPSNGEVDMKITFLCHNRLAVVPSIDHRMNAVKALSLGIYDYECLHFVVSGDSDGSVHIILITEDIGQSRVISSVFLTKGGRPILCLDLIRVNEFHVLLCIGDTGTEVSFWLLDIRIKVEKIEGRQPTFQFLNPFPSKAICRSKVHTMGTNCISVSDVTNLADNTDIMDLLVVTGGDDEALSVSLISLNLSDEGSSHIIVKSVVICKQATSSALQGVVLSGNKLDPYQYLYTSGYDKRVALWEIDIHKLARNERHSLKYLSSTPVDVSDVNCLDCFTQRDIDKIIVGGEGIEVLSFSKNIFRAARALNKTSHLLITCGAGLSADSGLSTYESMPLEYMEMCNPIKLLTEAEKFQKFWIRFCHSYQQTSPHQGYQVLDSWCRSRLQHLASWWIYSSNVDGHFGLYDIFDGRVCEIHGNAQMFRCACAIGYDGDIPRSGDEWSYWNKNVATRSKASEQCSDTTFRVNTFNVDESFSTVKCSNCHLLARPNVLMFNDTDSNILKEIMKNRERYQTWEASVENDIVESNNNLVILEIGAGINVPAVREESEEVFRDCVASLSESPTNGSVTLIRINPKNEEISCLEGYFSSNHSTVSICEGAERALLMIDRDIELIKSLQEIPY